MFRVAIAQYEGSTTLRAPPLAAASASRRFTHDWLDYTVRIGERPQPHAVVVELRVRAWPPPPADPAARLDAFLALGWSKQTRFLVEHVGKHDPAPAIGATP